MTGLLNSRKRGLCTAFSVDEVDEQHASQVNYHEYLQEREMPKLNMAFTKSFGTRLDAEREYFRCNEKKLKRGCFGTVLL